jgi:stringent starvation protein B
MATATKMTSNRPYLVRAMYDWISDNGMTPFLLVDARMNGVRVPPSAIKDGQVVLNVAVRAVSELELGNEAIRFLARFAGVSQKVEVPLASVMAIYAQENGQGMMFPADNAPPAPPAPPTPESPPTKKGPQLRVVR